MARKDTPTHILMYMEILMYKHVLGFTRTSKEEESIVVGG